MNSWRTDKTSITGAGPPGSEAHHQPHAGLSFSAWPTSACATLVTKPYATEPANTCLLVHE